MAQSSRRELLDRIEELEAENDDLRSRLDEIYDMADYDEPGEAEPPQSKA